ncbi:MAG: hypothetical protein V1725_00685 [archaeon]
MDVSILSKNENQLLSRQEIKAKLSFEGAIPSRKNVRKAVAESAKAKEDLVLIRKIQPKYGEQSALVTAYVFENVETFQKLATKAMLKRHGLLAEEKKEEKK